MKTIIELKDVNECQIGGHNCDQCMFADPCNRFCKLLGYDIEKWYIWNKKCPECPIISISETEQNEEV